MVEGGRHELVPVDEIELDRNNPRIRKFLEMYGDKPTPEQMFLALKVGSNDEDSGPTYEKLRQSILSNRGIIQPIILNRQNDGRLVCVEGNTRVAMYRDFTNTNKEGDWTHIPALVHDKIDDESVHVIRLQVHLVGPRPWDPYSKAKYLHELCKKKDLSFETIVACCGGRQREIVESIDAYKDMEQYYRPVAGDEAFDVTRFSGFVELQKHGIKDVITSAGFDISDFAKWIHSKKVYPLYKVRALPRIFRNEKAREIFLKHDARMADAVLEKPDLDKKLRDADLGQLARALVNKIEALPWAETRRLANDASGDTAQALVEARTELGSLIDSFETIS